MKKKIYLTIGLVVLFIFVIGSILLIFNRESEGLGKENDNPEDIVNEELILDENEINSSEMPKIDKKILRSKIISEDYTELLNEKSEGEIISIELFEGDVYECIIDRISSSSYSALKGLKSYRCRIGEFGHAIFSIGEEGMLAGIEIPTKGEKYEIIKDSNSQYILNEIELIEEPFIY